MRIVIDTNSIKQAIKIHIFKAVKAVRAAKQAYRTAELEEKAYQSAYEHETGIVDDIETLAETQ